jgi:hypothetical protein
VGAGTSLVTWCKKCARATQRPKALIFRGGGNYQNRPQCEHRIHALTDQHVLGVILSVQLTRVRNVERNSSTNTLATSRSIC